MRQTTKEMFHVPKYKHIYHAIVLVAIICFLFFLFNSTIWDGCDTPNSKPTSALHTENAWVLKKGDSVIKKSLIVPAFSTFEKGTTYSISAELTYDGEEAVSPTCFFFIDHMFCRVTLDDEEIFSYMPYDIKKPDFSKSPGNVYVAANLPHDCYGKELTIEFIPSLDVDVDYGIPEPKFGDYIVTLRHVFWRDFLHNLMIAVSMTVGLGSILYASFVFYDANYRKYMFLGLFAIFFGLYNFTESDFDFYMIANPYYTYLLDYFSFNLGPICFFAFLNEFLKKGRKRLSRIMIIVMAVAFSSEVFCHFTGIYDFRETLIVAHVLGFIAFFLHVFMILLEEKSKTKTRLLLFIIPIIVGMVLDISVYYLHIDLGTSDLTFTSAGFVIFIIAELVAISRRNLRAQIKVAETNAYHKMAYLDSLTNIGNHRAYSMEKESIENNVLNYNTLTVIAADINNLKAANDKDGHVAGDALLKDAAKALTKFASDYGNVYRVGGDEFLIFLYDISSSALDRRIEVLKRTIQDSNVANNHELSLALGFATFAGDIDKTIDQATRNMYAEKEKYKEMNAEGNYYGY